MSDTCTSPSNELWLLDTDIWLLDVRGSCRGICGLAGTEEEGVEERLWEELCVEEWGDAGQMGVNAEAGGRVDALRPDVGSVDCANEWETGEKRVEDWETVGEVSGLVDGQMDEQSV